MSEITYVKFNDKRLGVKADYDLYSSELRKLQGRYLKRRAKGPIWTIPKEREEDLLKLISKLNNVKKRKEQKNYRRAVSESSSSESELESFINKESDSEKESEKEKESDSEKESEDQSACNSDEQDDFEKQRQLEREKRRKRRKNKKRHSPKKKNQLPPELLSYYRQFAKKPSKKNRHQVYASSDSESSSSSSSDNEEYEKLQAQLKQIKRKMRKMRN